MSTLDAIAIEIEKYTERRLKAGAAPDSLTHARP